jgi:hypothetical protein
MMPRPLSQRICVLLGVAAMSMLTKAQAFEERFTWNAPAACPGADAVLSVVAELTGEHPPDFSTFQWITGVVEQQGATWQLSLTLADGARRSSRVITAPRCQDLVRAAGVAIALALDGNSQAAEPSEPFSAGTEEPIGMTRGASSSTAAAPAAPPPRAAPGDSSRRGQTSSREPGGLHWLLEADALLDAAALRSAAPGVGVAAGVKRGAFTGFVHALFLPTQRDALGAAASVELMLLAGGLRSCYEFARGLLNAAACGAMEVGRLTARGEGLTNAGAYTDWWLAPSAGLALAAGLGSASYFRLYGDALVPILRESYWVNESVLVHRPPSLGFRAGLALGVELDGEDE